MRNNHEYVHVTSLSVVETIFIIAIESLSLIIAITVTHVTGNVHPVYPLLLFFHKPWSINVTLDELFKYVLYARSPRKKKFKEARTTEKLMATVFWSADG